MRLGSSQAAAAPNKRSSLELLSSFKSAPQRPPLSLQVRNLRPCVKVAFDFLAPTSVQEAAKFAAEVRDVCRVQPKVVLEGDATSKAAIRAATAAHGPEQTVPGTKGVVYVPPSER